MKKNENSESTIIIREVFEGDCRTISVEENGALYYKQTTHISCLHKGTETFIDQFLQRFNAAYQEPQPTKRFKLIDFFKRVFKPH